MSISLADAIEIIERMSKLAFSSCNGKDLTLEDAESVVWEQIEAGAIQCDRDCNNPWQLSGRAAGYKPVSRSGSQAPGELSSVPFDSVPRGQIDMLNLVCPICGAKWDGKGHPWGGKRTPPKTRWCTGKPT